MSEESALRTFLCMRPDMKTVFRHPWMQVAFTTGVASVAASAPAGFPSSGNGLWYTAPSTQWLESLPVGNGFLAGVCNFYILRSIVTSTNSHVVRRLFARNLSAQYRVFVVWRSFRGSGKASSQSVACRQLTQIGRTITVKISQRVIAANSVRSCKRADKRSL